MRLNLKKLPPRIHNRPIIREIPRVVPPRIVTPEVSQPVTQRRVSLPSSNTIRADLMKRPNLMQADLLRNKAMGDFGYTPDYYAMGEMGSFDPCKCNDFMYQMKYPADCGQVALGIKKCVKAKPAPAPAPAPSITAPAPQPPVITIPAPAQDDKTMMYVAIGGAAFVGIMVLMMAMRR